MNDEASGFTVLDVKTGQAAPLAMQGLWLAGRVLPVGARLLVVHTFRSAEARPIEIVYAFGLPRDAALRRFRIVGEGFQVRSDLRRLGEAQAEYERGISRGHLAALMRTYRDGRVNLSVGNIRPGELVKVYLELVAGVDLSDDGMRFRFPFTLAPCYHRGARAVEIEPGAGELELPEAEFGDLLLPRYLTDTGALHSVGFDLSVSGGGAIGAVGSPSHALRIANRGTDDVRVGLSREKDVPDRDLVLDIRITRAAARMSGGRCRDGKTRFTAVVPSTLLGKAPDTSKSVVFVLDRSGSMAGPAIEQAKKAVEACLGALGEADRFGLVAFDDQADLFAPGLAHASVENRQLLRQFLLGIGARGGTELGRGLQEGVRLAGADRVELVLITDGQVAGTEDLLRQVRAAGARLHCLGIGAASQDRFLTLLARTTGGVSRFLTPRERVDTAALDLFAAIGAPVASDVHVDFGELPGGRGILKTVSSVYAGHPLVVMGEASGEARGSLRVTWKSGGSAGELRVDLRPSGDCEAETVRLLQGARLITELESGMRGEWLGDAQRAEAKREDRRLIEKLEATSLEYGLASRAMALVAVVERQGDDASQVPTTRVVPLGMPEDVAFKSYFMAASGPPGAAGVRGLRVEACALAYRPQGAMDCAFLTSPRPGMPTESPNTVEDRLVDFAVRLWPDGGMPGQTDGERVVRTLILLVAFLALGHTNRHGPFRLHVQKMISFLKRQLGHAVPTERREWIERMLVNVEAGGACTLRKPEAALDLLGSSEPIDWPVWETFEPEIHAPTP